jgi:hypothetical protein
MRYYVKINRKGYPVSGSLVYTKSKPNNGRWFELERICPNEDGLCIQPLKPAGYFQKLKYYYVTDECCHPIAGSNIVAYCPPTGNYFEYFPACLINPCPPIPPISLCYCYNIESDTTSGITINWVECKGGPGFYTTNSLLLPYQICAQEDSIVITSSDPYTITGGTSLCTTSSFCKTCLCYDLEVPSGILNTPLSYLDCNGNPGSVLPGERVAKCITQITNLGDGTATPLGTTCTNFFDCVIPPPLVPKRCTWDNVIGTGYAIDEQMGDIEAFNAPYIYQLLDFTVDGVQYATGQTLTVATVGEIVVGLGLDGNIYLMNISDWMNTIGVPGFEFHDNMRVIDTPDTSTVYTIHILRLGPGGGGGNYYYSSQYGFSPFGPTITYGSYSCSII